MLDALGAACGYLALYTDAAGTTEVTGGSPAYARKAVTWNTASNGQITNNGNVVFDVPAGTTVRAVGMCTASSGGTQHAVDEPATVETWVGQGTYTITSGTGFTVSLT